VPFATLGGSPKSSVNRVSVIALPLPASVFKAPARSAPELASFLSLLEGRIFSYEIIEEGQGR